MGTSGANEDDGRKRRKPDSASNRSARTSRSSESRPFVSVTISSDFSSSRDIQKRIVDEAVKAGFNSQSAFAIKLALEEAMINAIKHGNHLDPSKSITVRYRVDSELAEITIEDQGPGFDRRCVPDPTADENIEKCSGRGLLLIEAYMNSVHYESGGRRLRLIKRNEPDVMPRRA